PPAAPPAAAGARAPAADKGAKKKAVRLPAGRGTPGRKYERTRHNVGFRVAEEAARKLGVALGSDSRWNAMVGKAQDIAVLLPQGYMNVSGEAVAQAARFWEVPP